MTDFSLKSKALLVRQLNTQYDAFFKESDLDFINLTALTTGNFNTRITAVATDAGDYRDSAVFDYNRVNLNKVLTEPVVFMSTAGIFTAEDIVARLNTLYGLQLDMTDIKQEVFIPTALTTTIGVFTLKTVATSLMYIGTLEVYFGQETTIRDWLRTPYQLYQSDGKTFALSGKSRVNGENFVVGKQGSFSPTTSNTGVILGNDGSLSLTQSSLQSGNTVARFRAGQLLELTGPSYETSYDSANNCLPAVPKLPAVFDPLSAVFPYEGALAQGLMRFSTDFDLSEWYFPYGMVYYVDSDLGEDGNDGSEANPLKTINAAIDKSPIATSIVVKGSKPFFVQRTVNDRKIGIYGTGDSVPTFTGDLGITNWSLYSDSNVVYQYLATGLSIAGVFDYGTLDSNGLPKRLVEVDGPAAVVATVGSYCVTSTAIIVQTSNSRKPDSNVKVVVKNTGLNFTGNSTIYVSNVKVSDTDIGLGAESVAINAKPSLWLKGVEVTGTCSTACLNNYGAEVFSQDCHFSNGGTYGTYHGSDRQTIPLGVQGTFLEVSCVSENHFGSGNGQKRGSLVGPGVIGIRFKSTYRNVDGYPIEEYGLNTFVAHLETIASGNQSTDSIKGALYVVGKDTVGSNVYGRGASYFYSCSYDNGVKSSFQTYGSGEIHLYNTPIGAVAQYSKPNPYRFIYTSRQITDYETA